MASHLSLLKSAVVAKLQEAPAVCSLVEEEALGNWPTSVAQAVVVRDAGSEVSQTSYGLAGVASWTSTLVVDCYVRATSNANRLTALDALLSAEDCYVRATSNANRLTALDALLGAVYTRLMADPTLGGTLRGLVPRQVTPADSVQLGDQTSSRALVFSGLHSAGNTL